ncbi:MAG: PAS domain-containing protein [Gammaproteobacteria bacterium]|nr:PAS domain-containing protein [Gammaproteobacteria bacterium]MBU1732111.1 PAS domain-containing protein [Gammaproteobacteria bacterium]MBU1893359.1 PAS domain-containing protein [Gammaproteobacteria bacterium]
MKKKSDTDALTNAADLRRLAAQRFQEQQSEENRAKVADTDMATLLHELQVHQIELEMQNEELRQARTEADDLLTRYTELYDFAPVGYFTLDHDGIIHQANLSGSIWLGIERSKLINRRLGSYVIDSERAVFGDFLRQVFAGQRRAACDLTLMCAGATSRLAHIEANVDETGQTCRVAVTDITEFHAAQQQVAQQLRQIENAELEWEGVFDSVPDPIFLHDKAFRILRCNKAYQRCAGMSFRQIIGQPYYEIFPKADAPLPGCLRTLETLEVAEDEVRDGDASYRSRSFAIRDMRGAYLYSVHVLEDITESKRSADVLQRSKDLLHSVVETVPARIFWKNRDLRYLGCNTLFAKDAGHSSPDELTGKTDFDMAWKDQAELYRTDDKAVMESGIPRQSFEEPQTTPDGNTIWLYTSKVPLRDESNQIVGVLGFYQDITVRKQAELALSHANRALATLSAVNRELVHATDEDRLLQAICQAIVEQRGYSMAGVGYVQHDEEKTVRIMAHAGPEGYLDALRITWAETERGMGPGGRAIRSGVTQQCQDIATDPQFLPWREAALEHGLASCVVMPMKDKVSTVFGILLVYAGEVDAFTPAEIALLEEMADDLAFGVHTLHVRHERDLALAKNQEQLVLLQDSLEDTVRAIAGMVEMRDPYTAGHQVRVAQLAGAIAEEMKLPEEQGHAIYLAGIVHDLGKIQVPSEILSKPGKITVIEYGLIKGHAQAGYEILKGIRFPWPIAQMVLQHHERMDGSGYPQGLKGEDILLGARILSVADVVEAISAHRPYRPGMGIEAALAEIGNNSEKLYDAQVVDACLSLFRERGFQFE